MTTAPAPAAGPALEAPALLRLLQLASPALPIGAFAYSSALEAATEAGDVRDEASAGDWILGLVEHGLGTLDVPLLARLEAAWRRGDEREVRRWSARLRAFRGSEELAAEDRRLGSALARALVTLGVDRAAGWDGEPLAAQATLLALAGVHFEIPLPALAQGFLFAFAENQAAAAVRLVPLGQSAGLRLVARAIAVIPAVVSRGLALDDEDIGSAAFGQALLSGWHENQYSRLFRS